MADVTPDGGRPYVKLAFLVAVLLAGVLLFRYTPVGTYLSREGIDRGLALMRDTPWAPAIFVLAYGFAMALALPGTVLTLAGGAVFGFWWGVVFNTLGANLGANAAFLLARWLGRDGVERLAGERLAKLDRATEEFGFRGLFSLRLIPLIPFNALNFGAGLTAMTWSTYAAATALGIVPGTVVYTMFADALLEGSREASRQALIRVAVSGALLIFLSLLPTIMKKLDIELPGGVAILLAAALVASPLPAAGQGAPDPDRVRIEAGDPPVPTGNRVLDRYGEDVGGPEGAKRFFGHDSTLSDVGP